MLLENRRAIHKFIVKHADARTAFAEWINKVEAARWLHLHNVKSTFNSVDYVKGLVIFNIGGNRYRVAAQVVFKDQIVRIGKVGTHSEYEEWNL